MLDIPMTERTMAKVLARQAERQGDRPMLLFEGASYTYAEVFALCGRLAAAFRDTGIKRGDHVAILMNNHPNTLWTIFALGMLGAVTVPVNTAAKGDLLGYFLSHSRAVALVVDEDLLPNVEPILLGGGRITNVVVHSERSPLAVPERSGYPQAWHALGRLLEGQASVGTGDGAAFTDVQLIMYTSGTTGPSKGVMCTHSQEQTGGLFMAEQMAYVESDILYTCLPLFHANALRVTVNAALWSGATVALSRKFSATRFWREVIESGATQFNCLGAMANILLQNPPGEQDHSHSVRLCNIVPALPGNRVTEFETRFRAKVTSLYGSTEMCCPIFAGPDTPLDRWPSCGRIVPPFEIRVVDDNDMEVPPGTIGEWIIRSREPWYAFQGYLDMPAETQASWRNGWFHSGDRGYVDAAGNFFFVDRKKESVRRRGENISSYEVEMSICSHPAILEAAVVPVPSELGEDDVMAYIVLQPGEAVSEVELIRFCEERMAKFMVPRFLRFIEQLPKTPSEKVEKYKLKQQAERERASLWDRDREMGTGRHGAGAPRTAG